MESEIVIRPSRDSDVEAMLAIYRRHIRRGIDELLAPRIAIVLLLGESLAQDLPERRRDIERGWLLPDVRPQRLRLARAPEGRVAAARPSRELACSTGCSR